MTEENSSCRRTKYIISITGFSFIAATLIFVFSGTPVIFWCTVGLFHLPGWLVASLAILAILLILLASPIITLFSRGIAFVCKESHRSIAAVIGLALIAGLLWLFRSNNLILGDGLLLIDQIDSGKLYKYTETLVTLTHIGTSRILGFFFDSPALMSFRILSIIAGLLYALGTFLLSKVLFQHRNERLFAVLSFWTLGVVQLFFGYVENYALPYGLFSLLFYFSFRFIQGEKSILPAILIYILICALHLVALSFAPAILFLIFVRNKYNPLYKYRYLYILAAIILVGTAAAVVPLKENQHIFVSITESGLFPYSVFSIQHLLNMINEIILVSVFSIFLLIIAVLLKQGKNDSPSRDKTFKSFAIIGALSTFLFSFSIDPQLGAFRDWDLLAIFSIPFHVVVLSLIRTDPRIMEQCRLLTGTAVAFLLFFTLPWLYFNHSSIDDTRKLSFRITEREIHYSTNYDNGWRMVSWSHILTGFQVGGYAEAQQMLENFLQVNPFEHNVMNLLAFSLVKQKKYEEAYQIMQKALRITPNNPQYVLAAANLAIRAGRHQNGLDYLLKLPAAVSSSPDVLGANAQANYGLGNLELAQIQFNDALARGYNDHDFLREYASLLLKIGNRDSSDIIYRIADSIETAVPKMK